MSLSKAKIAAISPTILDVKLLVVQPYSSSNDASVWLQGQNTIEYDQVLKGVYSKNMSCLVMSGEAPNGFEGDHAEIVQTPLVCFIVHPPSDMPSSESKTPLHMAEKNEVNVRLAEN